MSKLKNIVLYSLLILMIIIFLATIYIHKTVNSDSDSEELYATNNIEKVILQENDIDYNKVYGEEIVNEKISQIEYSTVIDKEVLYGNVYIGEDNKLYITDGIRDVEKLILDDEIVDLFNGTTSEANKFLVYAISKTGHVYELSMEYPDISKVKIVKYTFPSKILNFTNLRLNTASDDFNTEFIVYAENGKMYHLFSGIEYEEDMLSVLGKYIVLNDGRIVDYKLNQFVDSNGKPYVASSIILANSPIETLDGMPNIIIITDNSKLIYESDGKVYEYSDYVNNVDKKEDNNIFILLGNGYEISFKGIDNSIIIIEP